ncbi:hypothetical protein Tco_1533924 [Tanacetum coccineum]
MTMKKIGDQTIGVILRRRIDKEGNVSRFQEYYTLHGMKIKELKCPSLQQIWIRDLHKLQMEDQRNKFAPYPLPPQEGNMNGSLIDDANDSDLESMTSNQPMSLTMEDIVALTRWIEKMESVIDNSGCLANQRVKYAASSFIGKALTWWNTQVQARG